MRPRSNLRRRLLFACALCALPLGCAGGPLRVERGLTTGDKLRAIDAALRGDESWTHQGMPEGELATRRTRVKEWCADLRARLLGNPPSMYAEIDSDRPSDGRPIAAADYPSGAPGLYAPVERERADLGAAHAAGLLSDLELEELLGLVEAQAMRPAFRARTEPETQFAADRSGWLRQWFDAYANVERVAGAELPGADPNAPPQKSTRPWRNPDFWVDP